MEGMFADMELSRTTMSGFSTWMNERNSASAALLELAGSSNPTGEGGASTDPLRDVGSSGDLRRRRGGDIETHYQVGDVVIWCRYSVYSIFIDVVFN